MSSQQEFNTVADETITQLRFRIAQLNTENADLKAEIVIAKLFTKENAELKAHLKSLTDANGTSFSGWMEMKHELSLSKMAHNQLIDNMDLQLAQNEKLKAEVEMKKKICLKWQEKADFNLTDSEDEEEDLCDMLANEIEETMDVTQSPSGIFHYTKKEEEYDNSTCDCCDDAKWHKDFTVVRDNGDIEHNCEKCHEENYGEEEEEEDTLFGQTRQELLLEMVKSGELKELLDAHDFTE